MDLLGSGGGAFLGTPTQEGKLRRSISRDSASDALGRCWLGLARLPRGKQFKCAPRRHILSNLPVDPKLSTGSLDGQEMPRDASRHARAGANIAAHCGERLVFRTCPPSAFRSVRGTDHGRRRRRLLSRPEGYLDLTRNQSTRDRVRGLHQPYTEDCTTACQANGDHATLRRRP
jgi:hypothetical protein